MSYWERERASYPVHTWQQQTWQERVEAFLKTEDSPLRFNWPFPMGVFGTLRKSQCNNGLMHAQRRFEEADLKTSVCGKHRLAFLPHFYAEGLGIGYAHDSCAPFEIFYYEPENWVKMIPDVDSLEGFSPKRDYGTKSYGYFRTLAWLRLLPEAYEDKWFPKDGRVSLSTHRNMKIDPATWSKFERVPAWVYSSMNVNGTVSKEKDSPVIWPTGNE